MSNNITYISIGSYCVVANILKMYNLKDASYPFDWIFSNLNMVIDCLENNFKSFLDKTNYIDNSNIIEHKKYGQIYNHHNPFLEKDYLYYTRCVQRLNEKINSDNKCIFVFFQNSVLLKEHKQLLSNIAKILKEKNTSNEVCCFEIENCKNLDQVEKNIIDNNIIHYKWKTDDLNGIFFNSKKSNELFINLVKNAFS